jgi:hypothetical protein
LKLSLGWPSGSPESSTALSAITANADAPLLKTESGELSHTVKTQLMNDLPIWGIGTQASGTYGLRNPFSVTQLLPGTYFGSNSTIRVNGALSNSYSLRIEGQDATNGLHTASTVQTQPSVDAIQEVTIQTSNYAAEYGQVGGGYFNFTTKSGTNQPHGSVYDYRMNEALNASQPYTNLKDYTWTNMFYNFAATQSGLPSTNGQNLAGGSVGFPYASFLLGLVDNGNGGFVSEPRLGKKQFGIYATSVRS